MTPRPTLVPVALRAACQAIGADAPELGQLQVTGITVDSSDAQPGDVFAALPGQRVHGASFAREAAQRGAVAVVTDAVGATIVGEALPVVVIESPRAQVGVLAAEIYRRPADDLLMLGVTGTNGKTTTTFLLDAGLRAAGHRTGVIGTVATLVDGEAFPTVRTTPEASELHALLAVMRERGVTAVAMEVSSHALAMGRVDGCTFDVSGFTQLGSDHLDFHGSDEEYFAAKATLFTPARSRHAVVTVDDDGGRRMAATSSTATQTLGLRPDADWQVDEVVVTADGGHRYRLTSPDGVHFGGGVRLMGRFNVANAALAQAMLIVAGVDAERAATGIERCHGVPGRMERVGDATEGIALVVDYAHTADALARALDAVRPHEGGRVIVVFGCGGDRDAGKRPEMGRAAAEHADVVVVTDDNPRNESPELIRRAVLDGTAAVDPRRRAEVHEVADRRTAIRWAVDHAQPGDVVLVAGKGHETGQEIGAVVTPFDDRDEVRRAWQQRLTATGGAAT
jgi:UDP-N-acetylmuramoyl-L-alanyl-D-glutamate--2,6-diaminopimelate ligase